MKQLILLSALLVSLTACKKEKKIIVTPDPPGPYSNEIIGTWNLVLTTGGFGGIHQTPSQSGQTARYVFRTDNTCTFTYNNFSNNYIYKVREDSTLWNQDAKLMELQGAGKFALQFAHDTLTITRIDISDATTEWFLRK